MTHVRRRSSGANLQKATTDDGGVVSTLVRLIIAGIASVPLAIVAVYLGLIAALSIVQEVLAGFIDLSNASWSSFLNPSVILGFQSPGGTGGIFDALVGGPGAPGGTVSRYFVFMISGVIACGSFMALMHVWRWAREGEV